MAEKTRIGVLGLSHDHIWGNLKDLAASNSGVLVAAADSHPELRAQIAKDHGCPTYSSAEELLDKHKLDAVYVYGDNAGGAESISMAAAHGLHVMVEKPLASTYAGAARAVGAARHAGVQLMVNWPIAWWPAVQKAIDMARSGELGDIFQVNYRSAHAGPRELGCSPFFAEWLYDPQRNGAGALMDYCCYGAALTCTILGSPTRVTGVSGRLRKADLPAEDNAVLVMQHSRAISTSTASWTQCGHMTSYEPTIYGSAGTVIVRADGQELWLANEKQMNGSKRRVAPLDRERRNATEFFLSHIRSGKPITGLCSPEVGLMAQEVLEAGIVSAAEGRTVSLPLPVATLR